MSACTFFGHRESRNLDKLKLRKVIEELISEGIKTFYVGNQGGFDGAVYECLKEMRKIYPHIEVVVVLAYIPTEQAPIMDMSDAIYPPIEGHPKFAIERRNNWMIGASNYCVCYINHDWGGAYKFAKKAKRRGLTFINLGSLAIE